MPKEERMRVLLAAITALLGLSAAHAAPEACTARSGPSTVALLELYTSEGCDSCPPADRWLSTAVKSFPDRRLVALALHVDYWDYIGWKDPFAKPLFAVRQRELAAATGSRVVYTPQVVLGGRDHRGWSSASRFDAAVAEINARPARAEVELALKPGAGGAVDVEASARVPKPGDREDAALFVAVYQDGLASRVTAGENRGATLRHDRVVREWWGPFALDAAGAVAARRAVPAATIATGGAAAFVQSRRSGEVLQALALPACGG
jgi:hypothetical protein